MRAWLTLGSALLLVPALTTAQPPTGPDDPGQSAPPVTLTYVDGVVDIARDTGVARPDVPDLLDEGDRVIVSDGRAELVFADGAVAHVDRDSELRVDSDVRLRLVRGHVIVRTSPAGDLVLATPAGLARLAPRGEYDLIANDLDGDTVIGTVRGRADLRSAAGDVAIPPDDVLSIDPRHPEPRWARAYAIRTPLSDWADDRMNEASAALSGQPLPPALAPYAQDFAEHGQWTSVAPYGQVWMPAVVAGWRPYLNGSWRSTRYGWTWIDSDPWAWPVHHYGRWGRHGSGRWFWIPQASWGPAWVSWAIGPDHVGWSPLGWDSRPVVDFFAAARLGPIDLWASTWSVVPRSSFGRGLIVPHVQDLRYLPGPVLGGFVVQTRPPLDYGRGSERRWTSRGDGRPGVSRVPGAGAVPARREPAGTGAPPPSGWARPRETRDREATPSGGWVAPGPRDRRPVGAAPEPDPVPGAATGAPVYRVPQRYPAAPDGGRQRDRAGAESTAAPPPVAPPSGGGTVSGWSGRRGPSSGSAPPPSTTGDAPPRGDGGGRSVGGGRGDGAGAGRGDGGGRGAGAGQGDGGGRGGGRAPHGGNSGGGGVRRPR